MKTIIVLSAIAIATISCASAPYYYHRDMDGVVPIGTISPNWKGPMLESDAKLMGFTDGGEPDANYANYYYPAGSSPNAVPAATNDADAGVDSGKNDNGSIIDLWGLLPF